MVAKTKAPARKVAFNDDSAVKSHDVKGKKAAAAAPKKAAAAPKRAGIVVAKTAEEDESSSGGDDEDFEEGESDLDTLGSSDDEDAEASDAGEEATPNDRNSMRPYRALYLRHLPSAFQEPELRKFLRQFGATVVGCFVVRNAKSNSSRGSAYIRFSHSTEEVYDAIMEECHGMLLGGNTVTAKWVTLRKPLPKRKNVNKKLRLDWAHRIKGVKMTRSDSSAKNYVTQLLASAKSERQCNKFLESTGIKYEFNGFNDQLARVPAEAMAVHAESIALQAAAKKAKKEDKKEKAEEKAEKKAEEKETKAE